MIFDQESGRSCQGWKGAKNKMGRLHLTFKHVSRTFKYNLYLVYEMVNFTAHQYAGIEKYEMFW